MITAVPLSGVFTKVTTSGSPSGSVSLASTSRVLSTESSSTMKGGKSLMASGLRLMVMLTVAVLLLAVPSLNL